MIESLMELEEDIKNAGGTLRIFYGSQKAIVSKLIDKLELDGVYFNEDYSPYAKERTENMKSLCESKEIDCECFFDYYLD